MAILHNPHGCDQGNEQMLFRLAMVLKNLFLAKGRRKISFSFQASYFFARQGARREDSRSYLTDKQRSLAGKEPYQMGKLFFSGP